jgi:hypothetical protein
MKTNQTERVSDEELDQMIWKLERDGMTPKQLSLMRELREVRRAKGEPVAWTWKYLEQWHVTNDEGRARDLAWDGVKVVPLYTAMPAPVAPDMFMPKNLDRALGVVGVALPESKEEFNFQIERWTQRLIDRVIRYADEFRESPAPVVSEVNPQVSEVKTLVSELPTDDERIMAIEGIAPPAPKSVSDAIGSLKQRLADCHRFNYCAEAVREVEEACRAAMLNHSGNSEQLEPVSNRDELPTQSSSEVNDAAWKLYDMLTEHGPLNGYQFNNLKECFYEALKVAMRQAAPKEVG